MPRQAGIDAAEQLKQCDSNGTRKRTQSLMQHEHVPGKTNVELSSTMIQSHERRETKGCAGGTTYIHIRLPGSAAIECFQTLNSSVKQQHSEPSNKQNYPGSTSIQTGKQQFIKGETEQAKID